jgi:hypothetical protein
MSVPPFHGLLPVEGKQVPWSNCATDPCRLRSFISTPTPSKVLYAPAPITAWQDRHAAPSSAVQAADKADALQPGVSCVVGVETGLFGVRFSVFGNTHAAGEPDYATTLARLAQQQLPKVNFTGLPEAAVSHAHRILPDHGYKLSYDAPCYLFRLNSGLAPEVLQRHQEHLAAVAEQYEVCAQAQQWPDL